MRLLPAAPEALETERASLRDVVLVARLEAALRRLNLWLSDDNVHKAVRAVTSIQAASLLEANEALYTSLSHGIALQHDLGDGRKSQQVRFFDFVVAAHNDFVVTRQFKIKGAKKQIIADAVCFVNGIPLVIIECKSPSLGDGWKHEAIDQLDRYQELSEKYKELGAPRCSRPFSSTSRPAGRTRCTARCRRLRASTGAGRSRTR